MMRLFNKLPFRPRLLVSLFSIIGAYMCIMMHIPIVGTHFISLADARCFQLF
ncbi:hypothetical protein Patl1_20702 [Pistacia atlantica]|nr:hypothetical protein Patl1_20702 [Pistacia atlantica]